METNKLNKIIILTTQFKSMNSIPCVHNKTKNCELLRDKIVWRWKVFFMEKLEKDEKIIITPSSISPREGSVPTYNACLFDMHFHLREPYDRELKNMMEAGILEPILFKSNPQLI